MAWLALIWMERLRTPIPSPFDDHGPGRPGSPEGTDQRQTVTDLPIPPVTEPQEEIGTSHSSTPLAGAGPFIALPPPKAVQFAEVGY